ncbi:hypothetical protein CLOM_g24670 [Closterium sp. NIES-68]|nr:hypothetical protein CLOM_g24670 [Closterium sp. NIES-68]
MGVSVATAAASFICLSLNLTLCHVYRESPSLADTVASSVPVARTVVASASPAECGERVFIRAKDAVAATMRDYGSAAGRLSWLPVIGRAPSGEWNEQQLQGSPWRATCPTPFLKTDTSLLALPPAIAFLNPAAFTSLQSLTSGDEDYKEDGEGESEVFPSPAELAAAAAAAGNEAELCIEIRRERGRRADRASRRASRQAVPPSREGVAGRGRGGGREGRGETGSRGVAEGERRRAEESGEGRRGRRSRRWEDQERERERKKQEEVSAGRQERSEERRKGRGEERSQRGKGGGGAGVREEGRGGGGRGRDGEKGQTADIASSLEAAMRLVQMGDPRNALQIFTKLQELGAEETMVLLAWRGMAHALAEQYDQALSDFNKAIAQSPKAASQILRQRASVLGIMGRHKEAIADWTTVINEDPKDAGARQERGAAYVNANAYSDALPDLYAAREIAPKLFKPHLFLGLALTATGAPFEAVKSYEAAMAMNPGVKEGWTNWGQTMKEIAMFNESERCYKRALEVDSSFLLAYKLWAKLRHSVGDHSGVIRLLQEGLKRHPSNVELRYFEASCYHATGDFSQAVTLYDRILSLQPSGEERFQYLAFYQREIAAYMAVKVNAPFSHFSLDDHFNRVFKEGWANAQFPGQLPARGYQMQDLQAVFRTQRRQHRRKGERKFEANREALLQKADAIGRLVQYNTTGFLPNLRQQRAAGLAALDIMQTVRKAWGEWMGRGQVARGLSAEEVEEGVGVGWRDVYGIGVRWRQIAEPNDPIVWIDGLTREAFETGFGSVTPMVSGQTRNIRYSMNADRAFKIVRQEMLHHGKVYGEMDEEIPLSQEALRKVERATNFNQLWDAVQRGFFVFTPCKSTAFPDKVLNGTRLTITATDPGQEFAIRTPLTPNRWRDFDMEMGAAWKDVCLAVAHTSLRASDPQAYRKAIQDNILRMAYYWYNFMPLARGTAMNGYVMTLSLLLAVDLQVSQPIPRGVQVDWESILCPSSDIFIKSVSSWLYPALVEAPDAASIPSVREHFPTIGDVIEALSSAFKE